MKQATTGFNNVPHAIKMFISIFSYFTVNSSHDTNRNAVKMLQVDNYDTFQPGFFKTEIEDQDLYNTPALSEDIWKKFELLPSPPQSLNHKSLYPTITSCNNTLDKLQKVSDILDSDSLYLMEPFVSCSECLSSTPTCQMCIPQRSKLIQDCMWSGINLLKELNLSGFSTQKSCTTTFQSSNTMCSVDFNRSRSSLSESRDTINSSDYVDPTVVFPFTVNEDSLKVSLTPSLDIPKNLEAKTVGNSGEFLFT